jgi:transposase-like protein
MFQFNFDSIIELLNTFNTEQKCIRFLEKQRWNGRVTSPFDADSKVYKLKNNLYKCKNTGKSFNVKSGTLFENTKLPLRKWFLAIYLVTSHKKGISSLQLARDLDVTNKTSWFMLQRIRGCFHSESVVLRNDVEVDETFIGGKNKNRHDARKLEDTQGGGGKFVVVGMVERNGKVVSRSVDNRKTETLLSEIRKNVDASASIMTDEFQSYKPLSMLFYGHLRVNHNAGEYVNGGVHINTIESFWSCLKRGIIGIYHSFGSKHLQKYLDEFAFRYNNRGLSEELRFCYFFSNMGNRLKYKDLIAG